MCTVAHGRFRQVHRVLYLNARTPAHSSSWREIKRVLPRGSPCMNLYELTMDETEYIARSQVPPPTHTRA